jgi:hypothetical protein
MTHVPMFLSARLDGLCESSEIAVQISLEDRVLLCDRYSVLHDVMFAAIPVLMRTTIYSRKKMFGAADSILGRKRTRRRHMRREGKLEKITTRLQTSPRS